MILNRFAVDEEAAIVVEMERVGVPGRGRFCSGWGGLRGLVVAERRMSLTVSHREWVAEKTEP